MAEAMKKYAVVTGANKGIGIEICRQLACNGIIVVLTARNEKRGLEAILKLNAASALIPPNSLIFHQFDVTDSSSIGALADFIKSQFGKLDILINNAGILGLATSTSDALGAAVGAADGIAGGKTNQHELTTQTYDSAVQTIQTNFYGARRTTEALLPLLELSDSPRIVNVSSSFGNLKNIPNEWAKGILEDVESLTEGRIDEVLNEYLKDFKSGFSEANSWPPTMGAYKVSKAAMNAYTRILARRYPRFRINCICPGYVKTDLNFNSGILSTEEGAETPVMAALFPDDGPTGLFFVRKEVSSFD